MSLRIIKAGLLDTVQDGGRHGYAHLGIGPGGPMDPFAAALANALLGKDLHSPVLELHYPAAHILFTEPTILCLTGADFSPGCNGNPLPLNQPVAIPAGSLLTFGRRQWGARCYLSTTGGFRLEPWLNSYSTHLKGAAGGVEGRALRKGDVISYIHSIEQPVDAIRLLPWQATGIERPAGHHIQCLMGSEWHWMDPASRALFQEGWFQISPASDRMGYRLGGAPLGVREPQRSLLSSGVGFGTVQLLPNGGLIILMADHQTTGGYPRVAHVISAHLPLLAQKVPGDVLRFSLCDGEESEGKLLAQQHYLHGLKNASLFKLQNFHSNSNQ